MRPPTADDRHGAKPPAVRRATRRTDMRHTSRRTALIDLPTAGLERRPAALAQCGTEVRLTARNQPGHPTDVESSSCGGTGTWTSGTGRPPGAAGSWSGASPATAGWPVAIRAFCVAAYTSTYSCPDRLMIACGI